MAEFFNTTNRAVISRNANLLMYPFPLVVRIEAIDNDNDVMRALSFNYFNNDQEVDEFVEDMDETYGLVIEDKR
jgi:hypothetical protein